MKKDIMKYQMYALFHLEMLNDPMTSQIMNNFLKNTLEFRDKNKMQHHMGNANAADNLEQEGISIY